MNPYYTLLGQFILVVASITANAGTGLITIAKEKEPAAGFSSGYTYSHFDRALISNRDDIVFGGLVIGPADAQYDCDAIINTNQQQCSAVWLGKLGELQPVIKQGESISGFPDNTVFSEYHLGTSIISDAGLVAFAATLEDPNSLHGIISVLNGTLHSVLYNGQPAPGFPEGTVVNTFKTLFKLSDAGVAVRGETSAGKDAIWFWNAEKLALELVIKANQETPNLLSGCTVKSDLFSLKLIDMNNSGEILFRVLFEQNGNTCPFGGYFKWANGEFKTVALDGDTTKDIGMLSGSSFDFRFSLLNFSAQMNNNGDVIFSSNADFTSGLWLARDNGEIRPVVLNIESVLGYSGQRISHGDANINDDAISVQTISSYDPTVGQRYGILLGPSKPQGNLSEFGETHLSLLAYTDFPVPSLESTWRFSGFNDPIINNLNTVIFSADVDSLKHSNLAMHGLWMTNSGSELTSLLHPGQAVNIDGNARIFSSIDKLTSGSIHPDNSFQRRQLNDQNHFVVVGVANPDRAPERSIFYLDINEGVTSDCMAIYKTDGSLQIPCVTFLDESDDTLMYQVDMTLKSTEASLSFEFRGGQYLGKVYADNACAATFDASGLLTIPCIAAPDLSANNMSYKVSLQILPLANPLAFSIIDVQQNN
ncbi:MAG: hypothetical protein GQ581_00015 [Methyloprofundus sp.]|nr:hypothetical protein [Methyloprofundus sp.]